MTPLAERAAGTPPREAPGAGALEALAGALGMPSGVRSDGESFVLLLFTPGDAAAPSAGAASQPPR